MIIPINWPNSYNRFILYIHLYPISHHHPDRTYRMLLAIGETAPLWSRDYEGISWGQTGILCWLFLAWRKVYRIYNN
jgi:hypothetical protein